MSESTIYVAKLIGVVASGLMAGFTVATSFGIVPALLAGVPPSAPAKDQHTLAKIWLPFSQYSAMAALPSMAIVATSHALAAYKRFHHPTHTKTDFGSLTGMSEPTQLGLAALLMLSSAPWTVIMMFSYYDRLGAAARVQDAADLKDEGKAFRKDLRAWGLLNSWRALFFTSSFVVGVLSL